ncbi:recombinase RmuC [Luteibacter rhizovicinus DSM 16549]|uniref:Recombinase RmuC n=1 Tax=Luteibacter rhizovicinus DSM 16549 TaxID=1440763 RepID=A0A0G9HGM1_9GAMM|nr:DNA recombination protein RmuC [Luteibacter rhizovicinus]APG04139.1 recombinase RmuC [Luteibacter rhizovicinus DSM 16549]KLD66807.1 recombinase RmuC [Luteibacter rhizovicinus DSM 16549]KLD76289.1 recombinase RmuC [Xanthomonas hyacinthi DSM 19077]
MTLESILLIVLLVLALACLGLLAVLLSRGKQDDGNAGRLDALREDSRRLEGVLRDEQRAGRGELGESFSQFRGHVQEQMQQAAERQHERIEGFGRRLDQLTERTDTGLQSLRQGLADDSRKTREESALTLKHFGELLDQRFTALTGDNEKRLGDIRTTLETRLAAIQQDNAAKLEQMRATVDEKLQSTLETRLGQSFQLVSERLEAVQRGLGEMQALAAGVGDLKRVLTNVKTRGTFGEVQLGALLEQILVAEQYAANVATVPGSAERVEYAIRLPGTEDGTPVWLPIDAKYPIEDYQRLLDFQDAADADGVLVAGKALELRVREEAKRIHSKYVAPPHTTDFAILFLPTEGLYAEVIRRPGLSDQLQREYRVTIAGPTTLTALLNSLQMGFRTLAIEKRSSEVWQVLGAVKNEFSKFGTVLEKTRKQLDTVRNSIDSAGTRTRAIERKLRGVESLTGDQSQALLELPADLDEPETPDPSED